MGQQRGHTLAALRRGAAAVHGPPATARAHITAALQAAASRSGGAAGGGPPTVLVSVDMGSSIGAAVHAFPETLQRYAEQGLAIAQQLTAPGAQVAEDDVAVCTVYRFAADDLRLRQLPLVADAAAAVPTGKLVHVQSVDGRRQENHAVAPLGPGAAVGPTVGATGKTLSQLARMAEVAAGELFAHAADIADSPLGRAIAALPLNVVVAVMVAPGEAEVSSLATVPHDASAYVGWVSTDPVLRSAAAAAAAAAAPPSAPLSPAALAAVLGADDDGHQDDVGNDVVPELVAPPSAPAPAAGGGGVPALGPLRLFDPASVAAHIAISHDTDAVVHLAAVLATDMVASLAAGAPPAVPKYLLLRSSSFSSYDRVDFKTLAKAYDGGPQGTFSPFGTTGHALVVGLSAAKALPGWTMGASFAVYLALLHAFWALAFPNDTDKGIARVGRKRAQKAVLAVTAGAVVAKLKALFGVNVVVNAYQLAHAVLAAAVDCLTVIVRDEDFDKGVASVVAILHRAFGAPVAGVDPATGAVTGIVPLTVVDPADPTALPSVGSDAYVKRYADLMEAVGAVPRAAFATAITSGAANPCVYRAASGYGLRIAPAARLRLLLLAVVTAPRTPSRLGAACGDGSAAAAAGGGDRVERVTYCMDDARTWTSGAASGALRTTLQAARGAAIAACCSGPPGKPLRARIEAALAAFEVQLLADGFPPLGAFTPGGVRQLVDAVLLGGPLVVVYGCCPAGADECGAVGDPSSTPYPAGVAATRAAVVELLRRTGGCAVIVFNARLGAFTCVRHCPGCRLCAGHGEDPDTCTFECDAQHVAQGVLLLALQACNDAVAALAAQRAAPAAAADQPEVGVDDDDDEEEEAGAGAAEADAGMGAVPAVLPALPPPLTIAASLVLTSDGAPVTPLSMEGAAAVTGLSAPPPNDGATPRVLLAALQAH
jgi:adenosine/AMP kinase